MWILTTKGFISIVEDRDDATILQVRARVPEDITSHFPHAKVVVIPGADYRYRARVNRQEVAQRLAEAVLSIDYDSHFKDVALASSPASQKRYEAYYGTWSALSRMQDHAPYSTVPRSPRVLWEDE